MKDGNIVISLTIISTIICVVLCGCLLYWVGDNIYNLDVRDLSAMGILAIMVFSPLVFFPIWVVVVNIYRKLRGQPPIDVDKVLERIGIEVVYKN